VPHLQGRLHTVSAQAAIQCLCTYGAVLGCKERFTSVQAGLCSVSRQLHRGRVLEHACCKAGQHMPQSLASSAWTAVVSWLMHRSSRYLSKAVVGLHGQCSHPPAPTEPCYATPLTCACLWASSSEDTDSREGWRVTCGTCVGGTCDSR